MRVRHWSATRGVFLHSLITAVLFPIVVPSGPAQADQLIIQCPGGAPFVRVGDTMRWDVTASGGSGAALRFFILNQGSDQPWVDSVTGVVRYVGTLDDFLSGQPKCAIVGVTDGTDSTNCIVCCWVLGGTSFKVVIEDVHNMTLGGTTDVRLFLTRADLQSGFGGFDLLLSLESSALSFLSAEPGSVYDSCNWEYFSYRLQEPCVGCPTGLVHFYGLAETNPLSPHPACDWPRFDTHMPVTLATMTVRVAIDRDFDCAFVPIRFFWTGCGDNAVWTHDRAYTTVASKIFDYGNPLEIEDPQSGFPGYVGPLTDCDFFSDTLVITRDLELRNGGVEILCVDPIGQRGDINVNGFPYEIADAVMYSEYFVNGLGVFGPHIAASIAASDVNGDSQTLTLPDLIFLIRVILGDVPPKPKLSSNKFANVIVSGNTISITNSPMLGAALISLRGQADVESLKPELRMLSHFDGENTRVLLTVPFESLSSGFSGDLLNVQSAEIVSAELVDIDGRTVAVGLELPTSFALEQNYPNPFNNATTISFVVPADADYKLSVINIAGQVVLTRAGHVENSGEVHLSLDMSGLASGMYLYKLKSGDKSATRKMLLLK